MAIVKVYCKNLKNNPFCPHGPTLKFKRIKNGQIEEFFACSTYRDHKDCNFFVPVNKQKIGDKAVWTLEKHRILPSIDQVLLDARLREVKEVPPKDRVYCHSCGKLELADRRAQHKGHSLQTHISDHLLNHPSEILKPKECSKKEAQYFFAASTSKVIAGNLQKSGITHVLCLGTPRVHEYIQATMSGVDSLLLDFDYRYHSFWSADKFIWFNMFNHFIMSESPELAKRVLRRFLADAHKVALVMDPPFGGHIDPLAATVYYFTRLVAKQCHGSHLKVIWVFPYFRERHIVGKCPSLTMLDYKVEYENHKEFNNGFLYQPCHRETNFSPPRMPRRSMGKTPGNNPMTRLTPEALGAKGRKLGSPVRLFTNMESGLFELPQEEGYRLCKPCDRWVSAENKHCKKCSSCPSKDGRTYVHCDLCRLCVKPQWQHCISCQQCLPSSHICAEISEGSESGEQKLPKHKKLKTTIAARVDKNKLRKNKR